MKNQVAQTIAKQIGRGAFFMIGAKNMVGGKDYLAFKIMRNSNKVTHVRVKLNSMDLYDVEYIYMTAKKYEIKATDEGIYSDMLLKSIEAHTGLYTKL